MKRAPSVSRAALLFAVCFTLCLTLAACGGQAGSVGTAPTETAPSAILATEPATAPETQPTDSHTIFPSFGDPEWELANEDYGLYRYTGDMDKIELAGYSLSVPESWQDKVTVLRSDPAGHDDLVYVVGNALAEAYVENAQRHPDGSFLDVSFWDSLITIELVSKAEMEKSGASEAVENGHAALAGEDDETAYLVYVHDTLDDQVLLVREELVNQIGQEAYDGLIDGLTCTLEEAAAMITVGQ